MECKFHPGKTDCLMPDFSGYAVDIAATDEGKDYLCVVHEADVQLAREMQHSYSNLSMIYLVIDESNYFRPYVDRLFSYTDPIKAIDKAIELGFAKPLVRSDLRPYMVNDYHAPDRQIPGHPLGRTTTLHIKVMAIPLARNWSEELTIEAYKDKLRQGIRLGEI
jgi:hypothetical protein